MTPQSTDPLPVTGTPGIRSVMAAMALALLIPSVMNVLLPQLMPEIAYDNVLQMGLQLLGWAMGLSWFVFNHKRDALECLGLFPVYQKLGGWLAITVGGCIAWLATALFWNLWLGNQGVQFGPAINNLWVLLAFIAFAPFVEELIFRGLLQGAIAGYSRRMTPRLIAFGVTAIMFTLMHHVYFYDAGQLLWPVVGYIASMSLLLGSLRLMTGSIYAGLVVHMVNNVASWLVQP